MIDIQTVNQIKQSSIAERIQVIEIILQSLKNDIKQAPVKLNGKKFKPFKVRTFSLGGEVHVDRDELYSERG
ncbi:MAG: hypothetical protein GTO45_32965 [Candidatus Aminicenantes bacterium]|nr:hypothetical protein [Candidatus Aminicenantes bacterium]NIM83552.1 hypothetical protein [Candidatus Aminicenantes bacterium]NIN22952.1 hypothetical protein [Candidatus Aminicenantes bacterium]NIN46689.1 hypothetical protein [Candidatus Aminicenantes bacterium]NIN89595.1 hypothetical protein [Candidatus Aminicenantes bacterium]